jgi:hypothetical protein
MNSQKVIARLLETIKRQQDDPDRADQGTSATSHVIEVHALLHLLLRHSFTVSNSGNHDVASILQVAQQLVHTYPKIMWTTRLHNRLPVFYSRLRHLARELELLSDTTSELQLMPDEGTVIWWLRQCLPRLNGSQPLHACMVNVLMEVVRAVADFEPFALDAMLLDVIQGARGQFQGQF